MRAMGLPWRCADRACVEPSSRAQAEGLRRDGRAARLSSRRSLIRQVCEVDPLPCSQCGGRMKVIAVIDQEEVIYRSAELTTKPLFDLPVRRTQTGDLPIPDPVSV